MKSVPRFCCKASRNKAIQILREKFPDVRMQTDTGWTGKNGIEIEAEEKEIRPVIDFIKSDLSMTLDHFVCIN